MTEAKPAKPADEGRIVAGIQPVAALLSSPAAARHLQRLNVLSSCRNKRVLALAAECRRIGAPLVQRTAAELEKLAGGARHQGVVAEIAPPVFGENPGKLSGKTTAPTAFPTADVKSLAANPANDLLVLLDGVTDPRNLGAVMRVAGAFSAAAVIVPKRRSAPLSAVAVKAASGAAAFLPLVRVANVAQTLAHLQQAGWTTGGASETASENLFARPLPSPLCLVLGDEGGGLRRLTRERCDFLLRIPTIAGARGCLNVATAAAVFLAAARLPGNG